MKLAIGGATGWVGAEILRQALQIPLITSVLAISRRPLTVPDGCDGVKLQSVVLDGFAHYSEEVQKQLSEVDAFIWTVAITPSKSKDHEWDEVYQICHDFAMAALQASVAHRAPSKPLRFILYSGCAAERDQTKRPAAMPEYLLMRGQVENETLKFAAESQGLVQVCVAKPGYITGPGHVYPPGLAERGIPAVSVEECVAATLTQCVEGVEKDTLENDDLVRMGTAYLEQTGIKPLPQKQEGPVPN